MKKKEVIILTLLLGVVAVAAPFAMLASPNRQNILSNAQVQTYGISFDSSQNKLHNTSGSSGVSGDAIIRTNLGNEIGFSFSNVAGGPASAWHYMRTGAVFYNTSPIHGMTSLTITAATNGPEFTVSWGDDENCDLGNDVFSASTSGTVIDFENSYPTYFRFENTGESNFAIASMQIELTCQNYYPTLTRSSENEQMGTVSGDSGVIFAGTQATIVATPNQGYRFLGWYSGGELISQQASYTFAVGNDDLNYVARFANATYNLIVESESAAKGSVSNSSGEYDYLESVTIQAYANPGYTFSGWYKGVSLVSSDNPYTFAMPYSDTTYTAKFSTNSYDLTLVNENSELGSVTGQGSRLYGSSVTIVATPNTGVAFDGWYDESDNLVSNLQSYTFTMPYSDVQYTAKFSWIPHSVALSVNDGALGSATGAGSYHYGQAVTLVATPNEHCSFFGWYDGETLLSQESTYEFAMPNASADYEARFVRNYSISVYSDDESMGTVSAPEEWGAGLEVTIAGVGLNGCGLDYWGDENWSEVSHDPYYIFTMPEHDVEFTAFFAPGGFAVSLNTNDPSKGTTRGSGYYLSGKEVVATAECLPGFVLKGWYEGETLVSTENPYYFSMPEHDYELTARFWSEEEYAWSVAHGAVPTLSQNGKSITYGIYPQTVVGDADLVYELNAIAEPESNGWYLYGDEYYAKLTANPYSSSYSFSDGTPISKGAAYWFRCDPIEWRILDDGDSYFVVSEKLLDAHNYDGSSNNYADSGIRSWLNGEFLSSAFSLDESSVLTTTVDNSAATTGNSSNPYACANTNDKIFLLSYAEATNADYGFSSNATRNAKPTDYALARGTDHNKAGYWWLRSPSASNSSYARYVYGGGSVSDYDNITSVGYARYCVRPALRIQK